MFQIKLTPVLLISKTEMCLFTCLPPKEIQSARSYTTAPVEMVKTQHVAHQEWTKQAAQIQQGGLNTNTHTSWKDISYLPPYCVCVQKLARVLSCVRVKWCRPLCRYPGPRAGCYSPSGWTWSRCGHAALLPGWCDVSSASCFGWPPWRCTPGRSSLGCSSHPSHWSPPTEDEKEEV